MNIFESLENIINIIEEELKKYKSGLPDATIDSMLQKRLDRKDDKQPEAKKELRRRERLRALQLAELLKMRQGGMDSTDKEYKNYKGGLSNVRGQVMMQKGKLSNNPQLIKKGRNLVFQSYRTWKGNISESCFNDIVALIEAKIIDFQQKRKEKVLNKNAQKMNDLFTSGATNAIRILPNGEPMGDPYVVKTLKDMKKENDEVMKAARGSK